MPIAALSVLLACVAAASAAAEEAIPAMTPDDIVARVASRGEANIALRDGLAWTKTETVTETGTGRVKRQTVWDVWYRDGATYQRKVRENGVLIHNAKTEKPDPDFGTTLGSLYRYELDDVPLQADPVSGRLCWVLRYRPSSDAQPDGDKEKVAALMSGTFYVDARGFWIRYATGSLTERYRKKVMFVPVGTAHSVDFTLEQAEVLGAVMTQRVHLRYHYSVVSVDTYEERVIGFSDFRMMPPDGQ
ncbi:MAG TPA: hypothetical protein VD862_02545 [Candidatus Paceibacterota bacterium]|nr:hypothetical protein [Candidatus Paceibacterota bacterium]